MEVQYSEFNSLLEKIKVISYYRIYNEDKVGQNIMLYHKTKLYLDSGVAPDLNSYESEIFERACKKEDDKGIVLPERVITEINFNLSHISNDGQRFGYLNYISSTLNRLLYTHKQAYKYEDLANSMALKPKRKMDIIVLKPKPNDGKHKKRPVIARFILRVVHKIESIQFIINYIAPILGKNIYATPGLPARFKTNIVDSDLPADFNIESIFIEKYKDRFSDFIQILREVTPEIITEDLIWLEDKNLARDFYEALRGAGVVNKYGRDVICPIFDSYFGELGKYFWRKPTGGKETKAAVKYKEDIIERINLLKATFN